MRVRHDWSWKPTDDEFIPDLVVFDATDENVRYTGMPHLVVEVLSTDRAADLLRKAHKYAASGVPFYWVVDTDGPEIIEFRLVPGAAAYTEVGRHPGDDPATLDIGVARVAWSPPTSPAERSPDRGKNAGHDGPVVANAAGVVRGMGGAGFARSLLRRSVVRWMTAPSPGRIGCAPLR